MSAIHDYKSYQKYIPQYEAWKKERNITEAKRMAYIKQHPEIYNSDDIQRGKTLIRAIDIMDEYSQKRAEDMEVATEAIVAVVLQIALSIGAGLGFLASNLNSVKKFIAKFSKKGKNQEKFNKIISIGLGIVAATMACFPIMNWAAKTEVSASRRGRFEAMRTDLKNPNGFAVLTEEQVQEAEKISQNTELDDKKSAKSNFKTSLKNVKEMISESKEYTRQRNLYNLNLEEEKKHLNDSMTLEEKENAQRDRQLLTKLVEKIDVASQDYAENAELSCQTAISVLSGLGVIVSLLANKFAQKTKSSAMIKLANIITGLGFIAPIGAGMVAAQIQKQASRVGRYKVKQDILKHPEQLIYIEDSKLNEIKDFNLKPEKKESIFKFLKQIYKDNKEYNDYQKNEAKKERRFYKAIEQLNLSEKQLKDAKRLQKNTFKTFNKIDENSQKFSESIEALGQSLSLPILMLCYQIGTGLSLKYLDEAIGHKKQVALNLSKYYGIILLSSLPAVGMNALITKAQKKASRIADMVSVNELNDYREFRAYQ